MTIYLSLVDLTRGNCVEKYRLACRALARDLGLPEALIKSAGNHKYISRWMDTHGKWRYKMPNDDNERRVNTANQCELITGVYPLVLDKNKDILEQGIKALHTFNEPLRTGVSCYA